MQEINLSFNKIKKIENLDWLTFIKKLDLENNEIEQIDNLDKLMTLIDLHLGYILKQNWFSLFSLSLWERAGVWGALKTNLCLVYIKFEMIKDHFSLRKYLNKKRNYREVEWV